MSVKVSVNFDKRKLESAIKSKTTEALQNRSYNVECPHCHNKFSAQPGNNSCPCCHALVDLNLNIKF